MESTWATIRNEFQQKISQIPEQIPASILKITNLVDAKQQLREIFAQALEDLAKLEPQTKKKWGIKVLWKKIVFGFFSPSTRALSWQKQFHFLPQPIE